MDAARLIDPAFWTHPAPLAMGDEGLSARLTEIPELQGHVLFQTSGSSGTPKWIALSREALLLSAAVVNRTFEVDETSVWALALPLHHVGGFGVVARSFEAACDLAVFPGKWEPQAFAAWASSSRITHLSLVPTQVFDLVRTATPAPRPLRAVIVGGGRLELEIGQKARELGWPVLSSYGMTEAGSQIATQTLDWLGRPYQQVPIPLLPHWSVDTDEQGRLLISGPALFSGTVSLKADGAVNWVPRLESWHRCGDVVQLENHQLTPMGRADLLVKVLGELVDPEAIEAELRELSQGRLLPGTFCVVPLPDPRAGHRLIPVFDARVSESCLSEVLKYYEHRSPGFRRLQAPVRMEAMPLSELGKIRRAAVLEKIRE